MDGEEWSGEQLADEAIEHIREILALENRTVLEEHDFESIFVLWENVMPHLNELIEPSSHMGTLYAKVYKGMRKMMLSFKKSGLKIIKETEEATLMKLKHDLRHRDWKAVKKDLTAINEKNGEFLDVEAHELKKLHHLFKGLMKLLKRSTLKSRVNKDVIVRKSKEEYRTHAEYYFVHLYKLARAYERVFLDLWERQIKLGKLIKKDSEHIT